MLYSEAIDYLFNTAPLFQNIGAGAYKEGLSNTLALDEHFGHPHRSFRTIHVGGTNGKGSVSHTLAAILQSAGLRVGLYTSPHLVDFRERIRVNGTMIPQQRVVDFIEQERPVIESLHPSFFEITTALAFQYFREMQVDIAVIEVGLGGRLDCTNIITPLLSVITNISFDHTQFLGDTLEKIAREKAGIIKPGVPVVIGETNGHAEVRRVFAERAGEVGAPITFADEQPPYPLAVEPELRGLCQKQNTQTILAAVQQLAPLFAQHDDEPADATHPVLTITGRLVDAVNEGFTHVCELTGLMGRWQRLQQSPEVVCDTGHNPGGLQYTSEQLRTISDAGHHLRIVIGMAGDKDVRTSLSYFPTSATYYFTQASVKRAMPAAEIARLGDQLGLRGEAFPTVGEAFQSALRDATPNDFIFVGGSTFIVADLLTLLEK